MQRHYDGPRTSVSVTRSFDAAPEDVLDAWIQPETAGKRAPGTAGVYIALLRGINVGGKHLLPMPALAEMFVKSGCTDVRTYIQSGNVVFKADSATANLVPARIAEAISGRCGFAVPVVVRTVVELEGVVLNNPFRHGDADLKSLHVAFLVDQPGEPEIAALNPHHSPPDEFAVRGREIYLRCPNGVARTKLTTQYFDARLSTTSTVRNWNTVLKLLELARGTGSPLT